MFPHPHASAHVQNVPFWKLPFMAGCACSRLLDFWPVLTCLRLCLRLREELSLKRDTMSETLHRYVNFHLVWIVAHGLATSANLVCQDSKKKRVKFDVDAPEAPATSSGSVEPFVDGGDAIEVASLIRQLIPTLFSKLHCPVERLRYHGLALLDVLVKQVHVQCVCCVLLACNPFRLSRCVFHSHVGKLGMNGQLPDVQAKRGRALSFRLHVKCSSLSGCGLQSGSFLFQGIAHVRNIPHACWCKGVCLEAVCGLTEHAAQ
jgi:hypothetical protein